MFKKGLFLILICLMALIPFPIQAGDDSDGLQVSRTSTLVVAASDSSVLSRAQADYICDGTADDVEIQAAWNALGAGWFGKIVCLEGTYNISSPIILTGAHRELEVHGLLNAVGTPSCLIQIGTMDASLQQTKINVARIFGNAKACDGIRVINGGGNWCDAMAYDSCNRAIMLVQNGITKGENYFKFSCVYGCNYAYLAEAPYGTFDDNFEGVEIYGGFITHCLHGVVTNGKGGTGYFIGAMDNSMIANSDDFVDNSSIGGWTVMSKYFRSDRAYFNFNDVVVGGDPRVNIIPQDYAWIDSTIDCTHWLKSIGGSGVVTLGINQNMLNTGASANSKAISYFPMQLASYPYGSFDYHHIISAEICSYGNVASSQSWLKLDDNSDAVDPDSKSIGFRIDNLALKGIVHNGTSLSVVDLNTTLPNGGFVALQLRFIPGNKIEWFVNGMRKSESTVIPSGGIPSLLAVTAVKNGASASNKDFRCLPIVRRSINP
jgi:hypothetical protein